jgi:hypothetical protein
MLFLKIRNLLLFYFLSNIIFSFCSNESIIDDNSEIIKKITDAYSVMKANSHLLTISCSLWEGIRSPMMPLWNLLKFTFAGKNRFIFAIAIIAIYFVLKYILYYYFSYLLKNNFLNIYNYIKSNSSIYIQNAHIYLFMCCFIYITYKFIFLEKLALFDYLALYLSLLMLCISEYDFYFTDVIEFWSIGYALFIIKYFWSFGKSVTLVANATKIIKEIFTNFSSLVQSSNLDSVTIKQGISEFDNFIRFYRLQIIFYLGSLLLISYIMNKNFLYQNIVRKIRFVISKLMKLILIPAVVIIVKEIVAQEKNEIDAIAVFFASMSLVYSLITILYQQKVKYHIIENHLDLVSQKLYYDEIHISNLYTYDRLVDGSVRIEIGKAFRDALCNEKTGIAADLENLFPVLMLEVILIQYHYHCNAGHLYCKNAIPDNTRWYDAYYSETGFTMEFEDTLNKNLGKEEGTNLINQLSSCSEYCKNNRLSFDDAVTGLYRIVHKKISQIHNQKERSREKKFFKEKKEFNEDKELDHAEQEAKNNADSERRVQYIKNLVPSNRPSIQDERDKKLIIKLISDKIPLLLVSAESRLGFSDELKFPDESSLTQFLSYI